MSAGSHPFVSWLQGPKSGENQEEEEQGIPQVKKKKKSLPAFLPVEECFLSHNACHCLKETTFQNLHAWQYLISKWTDGWTENGMLVLISFHKQCAIPEVCKLYHYIITHAPPNLHSGYQASGAC